jgi:hypothetical protein
MLERQPNRDALASRLARNGDWISSDEEKKRDAKIMAPKIKEIKGRQNYGSRVATESPRRQNS